ncbi:RecE family exodeoxyribonuclease [Serratia liquefaciens]|uniref:RecE family exodeoxyribonuclease n=1 Tax=Serratia liquefaciens TaxID=614 RepID=UPI003EC64922
MQNVYAFYLKAKQKTGKPSLFIWFDAKNDDRAQRDLANYIEDAELEPKDYFKAARTDYPVYDDLPPEGEFSDTWCDRYELADDKRTWQLIPTAGEQQKEQEQHKPAGDAAAAEIDNGTETQQVQKPANESDLPSHSQDPRAYFSKLSQDVRNTAVLIHGFGVIDKVLTKAQMKTVITTSLDKEHPYYSTMLDALRLSAVSAMKPERLASFVAGVGRRFEEGDPGVNLTNVRNFVVQLLATDNFEETYTGAVKPAEEPLRTESGAILTNGTEPATGTPIDSLQMLETVIGCALYPSDFDISNPPGSIIRAVTEMKKRNDKTLNAWNEQLSNTPGVLQFSREAIVTLIRGAEENLYITPGALRTYINANLIEVDPKAVQQKRETTQQNGVEAQQIASNEGEKEEVATVDTTVIEFETERRAWIRGEVVAALSGDTGVMGGDDVAELMAAIGDGVSYTYVARLLAKEIEPCDPFQQLAADEIHHLTCDVLENWVDDKDPRVAFINERVEFYLREARQALEQTEASAPTSGELRSMGSGQFDVSTLFAESPLANVTIDEPASNDFRENEVLTTENVREFLNSSTKAVDVSGEAAQLSGENQPVATLDDNQRHVAPAYFEPGRYHDIPNEVYHSANGISSTMAKDARISLMYYHGRHVIKSIQRERTDALTFGSLVHTLALEPEKLDTEFSVEPLIPEGAFTDTASMRAFIDKHNAALPKQADADTLRAVIEKHNATLPVPYALGGNADEIGQFYGLLPVEFQRIGEDQKPTATAMKACIKEYNATLPVPLKTSGSRDALLEQLEAIDPALVELERAIPAPLPVSGSKEDMAARIKTILPTAIFADELISAWRNASDQRQPITQQQIQYAKAIQRALFTHPSAGPLLQHPQRAVEVSYFGIDEETGLDVRVRPDLEIEAGGLRTGFDLKTVTMGNVKQSALRARLHREIIERDYHLSAGMYCDVAAFDQFFWIFVNKDEHYHWIAIVEASADLLELGRLEYRKTLRDIKRAQDTGEWPEPITEEIVDDINDFDQRRMEALRVA